MTVHGGPAAITAEQWRQIVNSALDTAIISLDWEGRVTSWNEGARRLLGWTEQEMLGLTIERIFPGDEATDYLEREMAEGGNFEPECASSHLDLFHLQHGGGVTRIP